MSKQPTVEADLPVSRISAVSPVLPPVQPAVGGRSNNSAHQPELARHSSEYQLITSRGPAQQTRATVAAAAEEVATNVQTFLAAFLHLLFHGMKCPKKLQYVGYL